MAKLTKDFQYYKTFDILGINVDFIDMSEALSEMERWVDTSKKYQIVTPNPEQIVLARNDYRFRKILNEAALRIPDGMGLVWAAKWLAKSKGAFFQKEKFLALRSPAQKFFSSNRTRTSVTSQYCHRRDAVNAKKENFRQVPRTHKLSKFQRLAGADLMLAMCKLAAKKGWRVLLFGGQPGIASLAAKKIKNSKIKMQNYNAKFKIIGIDGALDIQKETQEEREQVINGINKFRPHLLFVAYGAPWQEIWIHDNLPKLDVKVAMGVGGAFDYLANMIQRAPFCIRSLGFEWAWRLVHQPWRIRRQLALLKFVGLVIKEKISKPVTQ